jgi:calcium-dependent protein kinase
MFKKKLVKGDTEIKIIDFGLSKQNKSAKIKMKTTCGTPYYVAPEVLDGSGYDSECDIWSLGVIMYILLSGYLPFHGNTLSEIYDKIIEQDPSFERKCWEKVSDAAIELIKKCLTRKPKNRITAVKALESSWFKEVEEKEKNPLSEEVIQALKSYDANSVLKKEAMNILIKMLKDDEIEDLREQFRAIDKDYTGTISPKELEEAIRAAGKNVTADEIKRIISKVDYLQNGKINYSEFLAATISARTVITNEMLWALFKHFDTDNSGYISSENIKESLEKAGRSVTDEEVNNILTQHDIAKNGQITFDEFKVMMSNLKVAEIQKTLA